MAGGSTCRGIVNSPLARSLQQLKRRLPTGVLRQDSGTLDAHAGDKWFAARTPDAVALPRTTKEVVAILQFAHRHAIPVTARGAGHGYVGGCVPQRGGIALSLARMNRILEINPRDFVAVVEPGVITATLQAKVERLGLFYPPDPASRADCSIGGNIATNAGGPRSVKYGVTRDYVLGIEVVLADGTVARLGGRVHKNKTGFDLHRLFVGSEGLLGVVTEATLKLLPLPPHRAIAAVGFDTMKAACASVRAVFDGGFLPCAVELADEFTLNAARDRTGTRRFDGCRAYLIVELDGQRASVRAEMRELRAILARRRPRTVQVVDGAVACEQIWKVRREFSYALRDTGLTKLNEDVVVPRGAVEKLFALGARLHRRHAIRVACFGHAGDGNIHVNLMLDESQPGVRRRAHAALDELFRGVLALGGAITGEHGIGLAKKPWWNLAVPAPVRRAHARIKRALDPRGILNPGKFV